MSKRKNRLYIRRKIKTAKGPYAITVTNTKKNGFKNEHKDKQKTSSIPKR